MSNKIAWQENARCKTDPDRQYPQPADYPAVHKARLVCARCPVSDTCLREALNTGDEHGVWGGYTGPERARLAAGLLARKCVGCRLSFVPASPERARCSGCPTGETGRQRGPNHRNAPRAIVPHRDAIEQWAAAGWNDVRIGAELGMRPEAVRRARGVWGIRAGHRVALAAASNRCVRRRESVPSKSDAALAA